jgi:lactoylglutathione lyase
VEQDKSWRFDHVHIYCSDLAATERWLVETIGAEFVRRRASGETPGSVVRLAGGQIFLREAHKDEVLDPAGPRRFGIGHVAVLVPDLEAAAAELRQRGAHFDVEPFEFMPGLFMSYVLGPDNVRIEFVQRRD